MIDVHRAAHTKKEKELPPNSDRSPGFVAVQAIPGPACILSDRVLGAKDQHMSGLIVVLVLILVTRWEEPMYGN